jgi:hypothetical protein
MTSTTERGHGATAWRRTSAFDWGSVDLGHVDPLVEGCAPIRGRLSSGGDFYTFFYTARDD